MAYKKRAPARAKRNFRRVAKKMVSNYKKGKPRFIKKQGDTKDFLKVTMHRELFKRDFRTADDQSMVHDILFNPHNNVSATPNGVSTSNLFYHPSISSLTDNLYNKYRVACIVMKISRPNVNFNWTNTAGTTAQSIQLPTIPWGTKIMHSYLTYNPDSTTNQVQSNTTLTPRINLLTPNNWRECVDDGKHLFKTHTYKRSVTRVWKPVNDYERRFRSLAQDDQELCRGGIHIRFEKDHPVDFYNVTANGSNWNYNENIKILDIEATVYMQYTDRK